ncbi:MAG: adenosylcobinamide-phosphate synthase CbiB [Pseudomonadota bacterium]
MIERALPLLAAGALDRWLGEPDWLWQRVTHPIVLMGRTISWLEQRCNRSELGRTGQRLGGVFTTLVLVVGAATLGQLLSLVLGLAGWIPLIGIVAWGAEVALVAVLLAGKSLRDHVAAVEIGLDRGGLDGGRAAVAMIVGRDPKTLDEAGVVRAAIETSAENYSDGLIAPAFWYLLAGLPGILVYKVINTSDSMVGYRSERYRDYGWAAARLDDVLNFIPARLSAVLIAAAAPVVKGDTKTCIDIMWRDARKHNSPNAGWPESAMAAALGVALAGPRTYDGKVVETPWLNGVRGDKRPGAQKISAALKVTSRADVLAAIVLAGLALVQIVLG